MKLVFKKKGEAFFRKRKFWETQYSEEARIFFTKRKKFYVILFTISGLLVFLPSRKCICFSFTLDVIIGA